MKTRFIFWVFLYAALSSIGSAQTSRVLPWVPSSETDGRMVYHPESVLFVHGINSNDEGWQTAITALRTELQQYYVPVDVVRLITADQSSGLYRASQQPYLHTFNYGDRPNQSTHNRQGFDHIEWNAWEADKQSRTFTNLYLKRSLFRTSIGCLYDRQTVWPTNANMYGENRSFRNTKQFDSGDSIVVETTISNVQVNPALSDDLFAVPAED